MGDGGEIDAVGSAVASAMAKLRWSKATKAQRLEVGQMLLRARGLKPRQQGKVQSKRRGRPPRKS